MTQNQLDHPHELTRRKFLKGSAVAAGVAAVGIFAFPPGLETVQAVSSGIFCGLVHTEVAQAPRTTARSTTYIKEEVFTSTIRTVIAGRLLPTLTSLTEFGYG